MPIGEILGGVGGLVGGIIGMHGRDGDRKMSEAVQILKAIKDPAFDMGSIAPQDLQLAAELFPEEYEVALQSREAALPEDSAEGRGAQMGSLRYFERVREEGLPLAERLAAQDAQDAVAREYGRFQGSIRDDLAARGRSGGGTELAARLAGGQGAMNLSRDAGRDLAMAAIQNRLQAATAAGGLGGTVRAQDQANSQARADATNRFNEFVSSLWTDRNRYGADAANAANQYNVETRQRLADTNAQNRQAMDVYNQQNQNDLRQLTFEDQLARGRAVAGALTNQAIQRDERKRRRAEMYQQVGQGAGQTVGGVADLLGGF
jgi:hypothetical protein